MKLSLALVSLLAIGSNAFVIKTPVSSAAVNSQRTTTLSATDAAVAAAPPLSPLTIWGDEIGDILSAQRESKKRGSKGLPQTVDAAALGIAGDKDAELAYFKENAYSLKKQMTEHGAVHLTNFELMKEQDGFVQFYSSIGMNPCLDPLHSVSARPTVDGKKNSPVYEAVNKESRKNFFIGMHNEFVGTRAPRAAAFVCFKAAEVGGEFILADGVKIFNSLSEGLVQKLYNKGIRYSVMELPFFEFLNGLPEGFIRTSAEGIVKTVVSTAINAKVDFDVEMLWGEGGYDNKKMLQARAPSQKPIVVHPVTQEPTWFCNVHSHSSKLRKSREEKYGAERFEDGASQINKSDMYFGDDAELTDEELQELDQVTLDNMHYIKMKEGDVVLLDNYKCMHGRNVFDGTRKHGVAWFGGWEEEEQMRNEIAAAKAGSKVSLLSNIFG